MNNRCDISFGFVTYKDIPIFVSALFSFVLGMLFTLPMIISLRMRKKEIAPPEPGRLKKKFKKEKKPVSDLEEEIKRDDSSYGID
jgi:hypothetical protein